MTSAASSTQLIVNQPDSFSIVSRLESRIGPIHALTARYASRTSLTSCRPLSASSARGILLVLSLSAEAGAGRPSPVAWLLGCDVGEAVVVAEEFAGEVLSAGEDHRIWEAKVPVVGA
jgi:hypothetical protein